MRTLIVIVTGLALSCSFAFAGRAMGRGAIAGALVFIVLWFLFCAFDYVGGLRAGYSALDELGIHILLFTLPTLAAWLSARWLS
jgi:hypothetical protein